MTSRREDVEDFFDRLTTDEYEEASGVNGMRDAELCIIGGALRSIAVSLAHLCDIADGHVTKKGKGDI